MLFTKKGQMIFAITQPKYIRTTLIGLVLMTLVLLSACGSNGSGTNSDVDAIGNTSVAASNGSDTSIIVASDLVYSVEDFTAVGYKNVTQFELDTLPGATDAWYGFFNQKDFELRFYQSHQDALDHGVELAEVAVGKGAVGYSKLPPLRFDAYAVLGNVVMLCELSLESCESMVAVVSE
jgi:hypothetical protein